MPGKSMPCIIDGVRYESINAAARVLGIRPGIVQVRLRSSNFPNYTSKHQRKVKRGRKPVPVFCIIKGVEYPSIADVTKKLKMSHTAIRNRLRSSNFPDYFSPDIPKKPPKPIKYNYTVKGKKYRSLQEIADMEGLSKERIRQKMNNPKYPGYRRI